MRRAVPIGVVLVRVRYVAAVRETPPPRRSRPTSDLHHEKVVARLRNQIRVTKLVGVAVSEGPRGQNAAIPRSEDAMDDSFVACALDRPVDLFGARVRAVDVEDEGAALIGRVAVGDARPDATPSSEAQPVIERTAYEGAARTVGRDTMASLVSPRFCND